jgi:hypothetical protein
VTLWGSSMADTPKANEVINVNVPTKPSSFRPGEMRWVKSPTYRAGWTAVGYFVVCLALAGFNWTPWAVRWLHIVKVAEAFCVFAWTIGPPIWFWFEFHWVGFSGWDDSAPGRSLDFVKYSQELSTKVWLAVTSGFFILYFGKDIHL